MICWLTSLVKPARNIAWGNFSISIPAKQPGLITSQSLDNGRLPIAGLLRGFGNLLPILEPNVASSQQSDVLHVSTLNFHSVKSFGKINVEWVDTWSAHLDFHPLTRTLLLFRFPTRVDYPKHSHPPITLFTCANPCMLNETINSPDCRSCDHLLTGSNLGP